ncbi:hypothetical protein DVJ77_18395 [Dyella tabacisoli]|uniref:Uncharacterized protein n=1 Tax=Dyella tabacisoli TaxID=2282381 RepID=A0A369UJ23_9GAMM|nr:hypothetical protein DVJ77_18395 [Dyella tabacisoli]
MADSRSAEKVIAQLTATSNSIAKAFLAPFEEEMLVAVSQKSRPQGFVGLNRHTVLHGESVDYGTKENGLRAISLLNYVSQSCNGRWKGRMSRKGEIGSHSLRLTFRRPQADALQDCQQFGSTP